MNLDSEQLNNFIKRNKNVMFLDCKPSPKQGYTQVVMAWDIEEAIAHGALEDGTGDYMAFVACLKSNAPTDDGATISAKNYLHKFIVEVCPVEVYKDKYVLWALDFYANPEVRTLSAMPNDVLRDMLIPTTDLGGTA
jgi:hypothetical protein